MRGEGHGKEGAVRSVVAGALVEERHRHGVSRAVEAEAKEAPPAWWGRPSQYLKMPLSRCDLKLMNAQSMRLLYPYP